MSPAPTTAVGGARFLDPAVLARIANLDLLARTVVEGFISGLHRSTYRGLSTDFAEHREYTPGDDIRRIDWRVWGRTDRYYVKEFEADTNTNFSVVLDVSRSMAYGSGAVTKLDYARYLAACLTYLARRQRDRVGLVAFESDIVELIPPSAKHLDIVLHALDRIEPRSRGALLEPMAKVAAAVRRRSILVLISDLYEDPELVLSAVNLLKARGCDVIVFHVLDPAELEFPFTEAARFLDLETGERAPVVPESMRDGYRALVAAHVETLGRVLGEREIDYYMADTSKPLDFALFEYLVRRERLARVR
ncbi:MAG: DUF58 domain-containing protein [Gemmatimonadetes bacterium]|nr:DUF58 domain-containing protein [Gemmatimonadota bacterium]